MDFTLNEVETRVLGSLIEKQMATPEYYPLTMNALLNACNQKSNREPVVEFDDELLLDTLDALRQKGLSLRVTGAGGRAPKHRQQLDEALGLSKGQKAALCVLMLRGPQTIGEIRLRAARLHEFNDMDEAREALEALRSREEGAIVTLLPRQPGRKEPRYAHLLCGPVQAPAEAEPPAAQPIAAFPLGTTQSAPRDDSRIERLEDEVKSLREELDALRERFEAFRRQFD